MMFDLSGMTALVTGPYCLKRTMPSASTKNVSGYPWMPHRPIVDPFPS